MASSLKRTATARIKKLNSRPELPPYWKAAQVAVGGVFAIYLAWQVIAPGDGTATAERPTSSGTSIGVSSDAGTSGGPDTSAEPSADPTAGDSTPPDEEDSVTIGKVSGGTEEVAKGAVSIARAATLALYTGDFKGVQIKSGEEAPTVATAFPNAKLGPTQYLSESDGVVTFNTKVDADGKGPMAATYATVEVTYGSTGWSYTRGIGN
jgi:hypothetical protein